MTSSLVDVCYEQIKDNYWFGLFGDFKLIIDVKTGYFNATKLCTSGGKRFDHWLEGKEHQSYIQFLNGYQSSRNSGSYNSTPVTYEIRGLSSNLDGVSGTYVCEELITYIACWLSHQFKVKVHEIVKNYYTNQYLEKYKKDVAELNNKLEDIRITNERLREGNNELALKNEEFRMTNERLTEGNNELALKNEEFRMTNGRLRVHNNDLTLKNETYARLQEDVAPKTNNRQKYHTYTLIHKNVQNCSYPYYVMRTQRENYRTSIKRLTPKYPNMKVVHKIDYNPNAVNLFNRVKEQNKRIGFCYNGIKLLNNYTEEQLINDTIALANVEV